MMSIGVEVHVKKLKFVFGYPLGPPLRSFLLSAVALENGQIDAKKFISNFRNTSNFWGQIGGLERAYFN